MNKQDIYNLLKERHIPHEIEEHEAVYTIEGMLALGLRRVETVAKNLFLRDDKKNYYLLTAREDRQTNLKDLQARIGSRRLSFAKESELAEVLQLISGAVTPLGVLNDSEKRVNVIFDADYNGQSIGIHPLENTATIYIEVEDLVTLIKPYCRSLQFVDFDN